MQEEFHVKVKKAYAAKLIQQLLEDDALEPLASSPAMVDKDRLQLIREERERYLQGVGDSFSWEQIKELALRKAAQ